MRIRIILGCGLLALAAGCGSQSPTSASATEAVAQQNGGGYMGSGDRQ